MGYAVVHCGKVLKEKMVLAYRHNERKNEHYSNPDIDLTRTNQNLTIVDYKEENLFQAFKNKVDEIQANQKRKIRKDCPWAMEFIISFSPEEKTRLTKEEQDQYFKDAVKFFQDRHGQENVVSAIVHYDETTPHMHMMVLPVHEGKLNYNYWMKRGQLRKMHTDFHKQVGKKYGLSRGEEQKEGEPKKVHMTVAEYKEHREKIKKEMNLPEKIELPEVRKNILVGESAEEYKRRAEAYIRDQLDVLKEVQKTKLVEPTVIKTLEARAEQANSALDDVYSEKQKLVQECNSLKMENGKLEKQVNELQSEKETWKKKYESLNNTVEIIKQFFNEKNLFDLWNQFLEKLKGKDQTKPKSKSNDMER